MHTDYTNKAMTILRNGKVFDFDAPDIRVMTPELFAYGLNDINRWNGHASIGMRWNHINPVDRLRTEDVNKTTRAMTDLHHSFLVYLLVKKLWPNDKDLHLQALLHDAGEVIYGDIIGPIKKRLKTIIKPIEHQIEALIGQRYNVSFPWDARIKTADLIAQDIEGYLCFPISIVGVNVGSDNIPSQEEEEIFWASYDFTPENFIDILKKHDTITE